MTALAARSVSRRYHLLLTLRFVPTGLMVPVFVLLLQDRGLSLAEIGLGTAAQGIVMLVLELPSGGLADALGRKPVLVLATVFSMLAMALLLITDSVLLLAATCTLQGTFRALDSGPLQSWYIDALLAADRDADLEKRLGRSEALVCSAIGLGALAGGALVARGGLAGIEPLVTPIVLAIVIQALGLVATVALVDERRERERLAAVRRAVRQVPDVVRDATRVIRSSALLTALVVAEGLWGFGMIAFETLLPPRMAELSGGADEAAATLGPAITAAWALSALGSALAPALVRRFGAPQAGMALRLAHGATVVGMGLAAGPAGLVVAYLATYWVHGATNAVHYGMVHRAVEGSHRATIVSANSLTSQVGGAVSGIALGALAGATSISLAMLVAAGVLAAAGPLYLVGRDRVSAGDPVPVLTSR